MTLAYPKSKRLLRRGQFRRVYDQGLNSRGPDLRLFVLARQDKEPTRVGITVTRGAGGAVQRNRMKRLVRESFRLISPALAPGYDIVVNLYPRDNPWTRQAVDKSFTQALHRAGLLSRSTS